MCFLPVKKDWGLKNLLPRWGCEGGSPTGSALLPHPGRRGAVYPDHKSKQEKNQGHATRVVVVGGDSWSRRNRIKIRAFFSQRWASSQRLGVAGVLGSQRSTNLCLGRTELLIKAGKWFQTHAALQVWGLDSDHWGTGSARRFQNQPLSLCSNANTADGFYKLLRVSSSSESSELDRIFALYL